MFLLLMEMLVLMLVVLVVLMLYLYLYFSILANKEDRLEQHVARSQYHCCRYRCRRYRRHRPQINNMVKL
jgi:uncharacterized membrane protein